MRVYIAEAERPAAQDLLDDAFHGKLDFLVGGASLLDRDRMLDAETAELEVSIHVWRGDGYYHLPICPLASAETRVSFAGDIASGISLLIEGRPACTFFVPESTPSRIDSPHAIFFGDLEIACFVGLEACDRLSVLGNRTIRELPATFRRFGFTRLDLVWCRYLRDVHALSNRSDLDRLEIGLCPDLNDIKFLGMLQSLRHLTFAESGKGADLSNLSGLTALAELNLSRSEHVADLSPISRLTRLTTLNLSGCRSIASVRHLGDLERLSCLNLAGCERVTEIAPVAGLPQLRSLGLSQCKSIRDLHLLSTMHGLTSLSLRSLDQLESLSCLQEARQLESLDLSHCDNLTNWSALSSFAALRSLGLGGCSDMRDLRAIGQLGELTRLDLSQSPATDLVPLAGLHRLTWLSLDWCESLTDLSALSGLTSLMELDLEACESLSDLNPLASLTRLERLNLGQCKNVEDLAPLASLTRLTSLGLGNCAKIKDLAPLAGLADLRTLELDGNSGIWTLGPLAKLGNLRTLSLGGCSRIRDLDPLAGLVNLRSLDLRRASAIQSIRALRALRGLRSLNLNGCEKLVDIDSLTGLTALSELDLSKCKSLAYLPNIANLTRLRHVELKECSELAAVVALPDTDRIDSLDLSSCDSLTGVQGLAGLRGLTKLNLSYCTSLAEIGPLAALSRLEVLDLHSCESIVDLSPLAGHSALKELNLKDCHAVRDFDVLAACPKLRDLGEDMDPELKASVLAPCATKRNDKPFVKENIRRWVGVAKRAKNPSLLFPRLARAIALGKGTAWAIAAMVDLIRAGRARSDLDAPTWEETLRSCSEAGDPGFRDPLEAAVNGYGPVADGGALLRAMLGVLHEVPERAREWASSLVERPLDSVKTTALGRELAPAICLFYTRIGDDSGVREWLERATNRSAPVWRDRIYLALFKHDIQQNRVGNARLRLREIETAPIRDAALEELARHLAASAPEEAGHDLDAIVDSVRRARMARELATSPEFTASLPAVYRLLLALGQEPAALAELLGELAEAHPDSAFVGELGRQVLPSPASFGLAAIVRELLDHQEVQALIGRGARARRFTEGLLADDGQLKGILVQGLLQKLVAGGLIDSDDVPALGLALGESVAADGAAGAESRGDGL